MSINAISAYATDWLISIVAWFSALEANVRAALIGAVFLLVNGLLSAYIARLGVGVSVKTSRELNKTSLAAARSSKLAELQHAGRVKIAEARVEWIEKFRETAAELYGVQSQISRMRRYPEIGDKKERQKLFAESSRLKSTLLMRIDPNSAEESERDLEKLLRKAAPSSDAEAATYRRAFRDKTRLVLNAEWKKAKAEINQVSID